MNKHNATRASSLSRSATWLLLALALTSCATPSTVSLPPAPTPCPRVPQPPVALMVEPPPSGTFLHRVQLWQQNSKDRLNIWLIKSEGFKPTPAK